jgi:hypothetical protein
MGRPVSDRVSGYYLDAAIGYCAAVLAGQNTRVQVDKSRVQTPTRRPACGRA